MYGTDLRQKVSTGHNGFDFCLVNSICFVMRRVQPAVA